MKFCEKTSQDASDARHGAVFFRTSLHMTLPEPQRGEDPTPEKYISIFYLMPVHFIKLRRPFISKIKYVHEKMLRFMAQYFFLHSERQTVQNKLLYFLLTHAVPSLTE